MHTRGEGEIEISEVLRECVVFARHNVAEDPPFPRLDRISPAAHAHLLHDAAARSGAELAVPLRAAAGGAAAAGSSESLGSRTAGFVAAQPEHRLYLRSSEAESVARLLPPLGSPALRRPPAFGSIGSSRIAILRDSVPEQHMALLEGLLRLLCPPCLVLDENHDLVEVLGDVTRFAVCRRAHERLRPCLPAAGAAGTGAALLLRPGPMTSPLQPRSGSRPRGGGAARGAAPAPGASAPC